MPSLCGVRIETQFSLGVQIWLLGPDAKLTQKDQVIQLLVAIYKYRGRQTQIVLGEPLPARPLPPKPVPKNIVAEALKVKSFLNEDHQRTYLHASQHFKVTKARISQFMKIVNVLPGEFVDHMGSCQDQTVISRFSGKTLLQIAGLKSEKQRQYAICQIIIDYSSSSASSHHSEPEPALKSN